jgi:type II secretion system protein D
VRITPDVRTNSVVVQARPRDLVEVEAFIATLDSTESQSVSQIRIFPLKSATADSVAETLSGAIQSVTAPPRATTTGGQGGGLFGGQTGGTTSGGSTELRAVKSSVLQFLRSDGNAQEMARSGILADIRITPDVRTNSLVVTAPEESMGLMEALIKNLDRPSATVAEIKVFSLVRADATLTAELLQTLFTQQGQQGQGANRNGQGGGNQGIPGLQVAGADDTSSTLVPLRFSVDVRTNSIIAVGGGEALNVVEALLARLDDSDVRQREMIVYKLKNSYAPDVANAITQFLTSRRQIESADSGLVSPFEQIEREVVVQSEAATNSLLISATPRYFKEIMNLVEKLDAAPQQVVISALIVEVTLENTDEFGVELGFQDSVLFDRSVISNVVQVPTTNTSPNGVQTTTQNVISQTVTPGFLFNNQAFGQNPVNTSKVGAQSLTNFAVGRVNGDLGYGGLVLSAGSESVNVLLRALAARRRVDILSRPQIRTLDNQIAQIQVGQQVPIVNGVNTGIAGNAQPIVVQDQAGIILTVTPRITPDQMIVMEVIAEKSQFTGAGVPIFTDATTGNVITSPIKDLTNARATVGVRDGQTIVLGGMITNSKEQVERKVPFLGDIPVLGIAFRYDFNQTRRTELLMFLTPHVIRTDEDNEFHKQVETQRIHFTEYDAEAIHGPILAVPMGDQYCPPDALPPELMPYSQHPAAPQGNSYVPPAPYGAAGSTFDGTVPGGDVPTTVVPVVPGPSGKYVPSPTNVPNLSPVPDDASPRGLPGPQSSRRPPGGGARAGASQVTSAAATATGAARREAGNVQPVRYDAPPQRGRAATR